MSLLSLRSTDERVRIGKLICLLGNYSKHVAEMKGVVTDNIIYFLKPSTAVVGDGGKVVLPKMSKVVHHEVELAIIIDKKGKSIPIDKVQEHILGYSVFLDITARDIQSKYKKEGRPWSIPKGFDTFAPMSDIALRDDVGDTRDLGIMLELNGKVKQDSSTKFMTHDITSIVSYISNIMTLEPGDVIATGTPEGVGQLRPGDRVRASIERVGELTITVEAEE